MPQFFNQTSTDIHYNIKEQSAGRNVLLRLFFPPSHFLRFLRLLSDISKLYHSAGLEASLNSAQLLISHWDS